MKIDFVSWAHPFQPVAVTRIYNNIKSRFLSARNDGRASQVERTVWSGINTPTTCIRWTLFRPIKSNIESKTKTIMSWNKCIGLGNLFIEHVRTFCRFVVRPKWQSNIHKHIVCHYIIFIWWHGVGPSLSFRFYRPFLFHWLVRSVRSVDVDVIGSFLPNAQY